MRLKNQSKNGRIDECSGIMAGKSSPLGARSAAGHATVAAISGFVVVRRVIAAVREA
jgi:hypothetical protein